MTHPVLSAINRALESAQDDGWREHLGASVIGRKCDRQVWYSFRWFTRVRHAGKQLRLFNRGAKEEDRFIEWLTAAGIHVKPLDPATEKQWRISDVGGHFGGSLDGKAWNVPGVEQYGLNQLDEIILEFKTHNDKSFTKLVVEGVKKAKPEHYTQMQCYMHHTGLKLALYLAINKNNDEIHAEFVQYDSNHAVDAIRRAEHIIHSAFPPRRISEDPSWFECRFCDHKAVCHLRQTPERNCRTCAHAQPIEAGLWYCRHWRDVIPLTTQKVGCEKHLNIGE